MKGRWQRVGPLGAADPRVDTWPCKQAAPRAGVRSNLGPEECGTPPPLSRPRTLLALQRGSLGAHEPRATPMRRALGMTAAALMGSVISGCPVYDDTLCSFDADCAPGLLCDVQTGSCYGSEVECREPSDCGAPNETCGSDGLCHVGDCYFHGCVADYVCVSHDSGYWCGKESDANPDNDGESGDAGGGGAAGTAGLNEGALSRGGNGDGTETLSSAGVGGEK